MDRVFYYKEQKICRDRDGVYTLYLEGEFDSTPCLKTAKKWIDLYWHSKKHGEISKLDYKIKH